MSEFGEIPISQIRPRFQVLTQVPAQEIADRLKAGLQSEDSPCIGEAHARYANLEIPLQDQHYWSPQLAITMEETEEGTVVRGLYGPRPSVWTMFVFFYAAIGFAVMVISAIAMVMFMMGKSVPFLWSVPVLILIFFSLYHVAYIGKKKGYAESELLHRFFVKHSGLNY